MLKLTLSLIQILIGIYWAGDVARQNPKIDAFVAQLEDGYGAFNQRLQGIRIGDGLIVLRRIYGWTAVAAAMLFFVLGRYLGQNPVFRTFWSTAFFVSFFGWFSIRWCTEHKRAVSDYGPQVALFVFGPLLMGAFDILMGTPFVQILMEPLNRVPNPWGWTIQQPANSIALGAVLSAFLAVFFAVYYVITWVFAAPAAFVSALVVALPVALARFVYVIAPRKAFFGLTAVVLTLATLWQLWL